MKNQFKNDCPYNCHNGRVFNPVTRQMEACPHCQSVRKEELKTGEDLNGTSLCEKFNIQPSIIGTEFCMDALVPEYTRTNVNKESFEKVEGTLRSLFDNLLIGSEPECSMLIFLGCRSNYDILAYQCIMKAYKAGMSVVPYISASELCKLRSEYSGGLDFSGEHEFSFDDYLRSDICIVFIDSGTTMNEILGVHGLMQLRARHNKSTIVFSTILNRNIRLMTCEDYSENKNVATLVGLVHETGVSETESIGNGREVSFAEMSGVKSASESVTSAPRMSAEEFSKMFEHRDNL